MKPDKRKKLTAEQVQQSTLLLIPGTRKDRGSKRRREQGIRLRKRILEKLAEGYRGTQIAMHLSVSYFDWRFQMAMLYRISGESTAAGLVGWAFRKGILK